MSTKNNPSQFREQARENRLEISLEDAERVAELMGEVEASYATIRGINTTGFEPTAIFVPTPSKRESN